MGQAIPICLYGNTFLTASRVCSKIPTVRDSTESMWSAPVEDLPDSSDCGGVKVEVEQVASVADTAVVRFDYGGLMKIYRIHFVQ